MNENDPLRKIVESIKTFSGAKAKETFFIQLEELGIHAVKARLESKYWGSTGNIAWAKEWIELKEAPEKVKQREEELGILRESNAIAKDANKIAVDANQKADFSNRLSALAVIISVIAALIAWLVK